MKLEVDFIKEFEAEREKLKNTKSTPPSEEDWRKFELTKKLAEAKISQYERIENAEYRKIWLDVIYPILCEMAKIQGGRVTLNIDEESLVGKLTYCGHELFINNVFCNDLKCFRLMLAHTEDFYIASKDGLVEVQFIFHLYDEKKVADHSDEIKKLQEQIYTKEFREKVLGDASFEEN